ncbi:MFS transporter [Solicola gregarius]|uniref:MFS transporter n=1 Tax=Solicola gregarius TaxID=2908642 RepID=A0AA46TGS7_9ACTN|nr:MFS transporter [Solicola gregarius]UYM05079.1 MFS transporter [Solicola gregarius]
MNERRSWYFYDWANSAYFTTVTAVLFAPYLTSVAETAACGEPGTTDDPCNTDLLVAGVSVSPGSLVFYIITLSTLLSAVLVPLVGAFADGSPSKRRMMCAYAWVGSASTAAMVFIAGSNWHLGAVLLVISSVAGAASLSIYHSILVDIAGPDERDVVSSRGWAFGYLGGGTLLALNLVLVTAHDAVGLDTQGAVRISLLSAGVWWAAFTIIPFRGLRDRPPRVTDARRDLMWRSFGRLYTTLREARAYPRTLLFLAAFLFFNDGIQTVIASASVYGEKALGFETGFLIGAILMVQFVAFGGALLFGRLAGRTGTKNMIVAGLVGWMAIVSIGYFLPAGNAPLFLVLALGIGIVLGGTQALSRSLFSQLIPRGREAEYFALYQACERGTSWLGTLLFGVVHQLTDSYRPAIFALIAFFVIGLAILGPLNVRRAIREAGNLEPKVV